MKKISGIIQKHPALIKPCETSLKVVKIELSEKEKNMLHIAPDEDSMLSVLNPVVLRKRYASIKSCIEAHQLEEITFRELVKCYGRKSVLKHIEVRFVLLNTEYNIPEDRKFTLPQIEELADVILSDFSNLNIAEFTYFFKMVKMGEFGEMYRSLEIDFFLKALNKYKEKKRMQYCHANNRKSKLHNNDKIARIE